MNVSKARDNSTWAVSWLAELTVTSLPSPSFPLPLFRESVSKTSACRFKTSHTCGRGAGTHGDVLNLHTEVFFCVPSRATHHTTHHTTHTTQHNTTQHNTTHNTTHTTHTTLRRLLMFEVFAGHRLLTEKTVRPQRRPCRPLFFFLGFPELEKGKRSDMAVSFFIAFSGLWVISRGVLLGLFLVNLVLILLDCRI